MNISNTSNLDLDSAGDNAACGGPKPSNELAKAHSENQRWVDGINIDRNYVFWKFVFDVRTP